MQADLFTPGQAERRKGAQVLQENHSGQGPAPKARAIWMKNEIQVNPAQGAPAPDRT